MCIPGALSAIGGLISSAGGATALATVGSAVSGVTQFASGLMEGAALEDQAQQERQIGSIEADRIRQRFRAQIGQQAVEMAGRGYRLDSPSAIYLAEQAGREMTFDADAAASRRNANAASLTASARAARGRGFQSLLRGGFSAAASMLTEEPELWPGLG